MLTVRQLLAASGQISGDLHTNALPRQFVGKSLSLRSAIALYEKQQRIYFVSLVSPRILLSNDVHTFEDLMRLSSSPEGQMTKDEVEALTSDLERAGILLRLVDKDFRHGALIGTVPALANAPAVEVNGQNFVQVRDKYGSLEAIGGGIVSAGGAFIGVGSVLGPSWLLIGVGIGITGWGLAFLAVIGILDLMQDNTPLITPSQNTKKSEVESPDGQADASDQDTIEIPDAVAIGDPPKGFDVDKIVTDLGDSALDQILSDIPVGWDPDTGTGIPLGGGDFGGQGDEGGGGGGIDAPF